MASMLILGPLSLVFCGSVYGAGVNAWVPVVTTPTPPAPPQPPGYYVFHPLLLLNHLTYAPVPTTTTPEPTTTTTTPAPANPPSHHYGFIPYLFFNHLTYTPAPTPVTTTPQPFTTNPPAAAGPPSNYYGYNPYQLLSQLTYTYAPSPSNGDNTDDSGTMDDVATDGCQSNGQFLPHPGGSCFYIECVIRSEPWQDSEGNVILDMLERPCAPGTGVPSTYTGGITNPCVSFNSRCGTTPSPATDAPDTPIVTDAPLPMAYPPAAHFPYSFPFHGYNPSISLFGGYSGKRRK